MTPFYIARVECQSHIQRWLTRRSFPAIDVKALEADGWKLTPELLATLSPSRTHHLNRFGLHELKEVVPMPVDYRIKFDIEA